MRHNTVSVIIVAAVLLIIGYVVCSSMRVPHYNPLPGAMIRLEIARKINVKDVEAITILLNEPSGKELTLKRGHDDSSIRILINSIKQLKVPKQEYDVDETDRIIISKNDGDSIAITGCFNPDHVPVVSRTYCSDDLAKIICDIFDRKGISSDKTR